MQAPLPFMCGKVLLLAFPCVGGEPGKYISKLNILVCIKEFYQMNWYENSTHELYCTPLSCTVHHLCISNQQHCQCIDNAVGCLCISGVQYNLLIITMETIRLTAV